MNEPLTRGEFREAAAKLASKADLSAAIAPLASKADLAPLATKAELARFATKADLEALRLEISADLGHMVHSMEENILRQLAGMFDPYQSHESRLRKLEQAVFEPPPKKRARRRSA